MVKINIILILKLKVSELMKEADIAISAGARRFMNLQDWNSSYRVCIADNQLNNLRGWQMDFLNIAAGTMTQIYFVI